MVDVLKLGSSYRYCDTSELIRKAFEIMKNLQGKFFRDFAWREVSQLNG